MHTNRSQFPRDQFDEFDRSFNQAMRRTTGLAVAGFIFTGLVSIAIFSVVIWAIVRLVLHFT